MVLEFRGETFEWRGPAPFVFVRVPSDDADEIRALAPLLTYGWGCIPVQARIGATEFTTSLFPRDGGYLVPVKVAVQRAEEIGVGDAVSVRLEFALRDPGSREASH